MGIFGLFWIFKKPFLNILVYLLLLLYSIIKNVFFIGKYKGFWEEIEAFFHSDAVIAVWFMWIPSIIGFLIVNIVYFVVRRHTTKKLIKK